MNDIANRYNEFCKEMLEKYPKIFSQPFGGFEIGEGWYQIIRSLCENIQSRINSVECYRNYLILKNPHNIPLPEPIEQVVVEQIKEKFGGLRFYYTGGDEKIDGMVDMATSWAEHTCEECGSPGVNRAIRGWLTTLCDVHYNERLEKIKS